MDTPAPVPLDTASCVSLPDCGSNEFGKGEIEARREELSHDHLAPGLKKPNEMSMYQRIIAALIPEEEEDLIPDVPESPFETEKDMGTDAFSSHLSPSYDPSGCSNFNSHDVKLNGRSFYDREQDTMSIPSTGFPSCNNLQNGLHTDQSMPGTMCSEYQYQNMSIDERIIMEVHSIGIYPDLMVCWVFIESFLI